MKYLRAFESWRKINESTLPEQAPEWLVKLLKDNGVVIDGKSEDIANMGWNLVMQIINDSDEEIHVPENFDELVKFINDIGTDQFEKKLGELGIKVSLPKLPGGGIKVGDFFPIAMLFLTWLQTGNIPLPKPNPNDPSKVESPVPGCFPGNPTADKQLGEILTKLPIDIPSSKIITQGVEAAGEVVDKAASGDIEGAANTAIEKGKQILGKDIVKTLGELLKNSKVMY